MLERLASRTRLIIDFGGGLKSDEDLRIAFDCGAQMITGGSIAVKNPERFLTWLEKYGGERVILGADAKDKKIAVSGWEEGTNLDLIPFVKDYREKGVQKIICTDIGRDGMLQGPAIDLYKEIKEEVGGLYVIASGGVSSMADIERLDEAGIPAVIFGKAIYEGRIRMSEIEKYVLKIC